MKCKMMFAAAAIVATFGMNGPVQVEAKTAITLAHHSAVDSLNSLLAEEFKTCVEGSKAVEMTVDHYPAGQIGTAREVIEQINLGAIAMTITDTAYMSNVQPELTVWQLPFLFTDWSHAERAMDGEAGDITKELIQQGQGIKVLAFMHNGFRDFMTIDKPVKEMGDFKGMKFRSPPIPIWVTMFKTLDAVPVSVPWSEVYTAMQSGLVEGMESTPEGFLSSKTYEVAEYITRSGHMYNLMMMVIGDKSYAALSDAEKEVVETCAKSFRTDGAPRQIELNENGYKELEEKGLTILEIDKAPLTEALSGAWPEILKDVDNTDPLIKAIEASR